MKKPFGSRSAVASLMISHLLRAQKKLIFPVKANPARGLVLFLLLLLNFSAVAYGQTKILICGVGQNVSAASSFTIKNIEALGNKFDDYRVIIYENNSTDKTASIYAAWARRNERVTFLSETIAFDKIARVRFAKIARARNALLKQVATPQYEGFDVVVMVDLDFITPWPIDAIKKACELPLEWDCISANGIDKEGTYYDRLALRTKDYPFGPEILGDMQWREELKKRIFFSRGLVPVFSAFGGLALYKKKALLTSTYEGHVTESVRRYYEQVIFPSKTIPIYSSTQCCEHFTLHAQMALNGHGKFFIDPDIVMRY